MATKETSDSTVEPAKTAQTMDDANTNTNNEATIIQSYCSTVLQQPHIEVGNDPHKKEYQTQFNNALTTIQTHATYYLSVLQPLIITNITNIGNYYSLNSAVATTLPEGSTEEEWIAELETFDAKSITNTHTAGNTIGMLMTFYNELNLDAGSIQEMIDCLEMLKYPSGDIKAFSSIFNQNRNSATAASDMSTVWKNLYSDLGSMRRDVEAGIRGEGQIRTIYLEIVNKVVQTVKQEIASIKNQNGILTSTEAKNRQIVSEKIKTTANANQKTNATMLEALTDTSSTADGIDKANKAQSSQALIIQNYANSVNEQPNVDFSGTPTLGKYETDINNGLKKAQAHANKYLNVIQPSILTNITNIQNYYAIHNAITTTLPPGSTKEQWIQVLTALENQSKEYKTASDGVAAHIKTLHTDLTKDSNNFWTTVGDLNKAVNGDNGVLEATKGQLNLIQKQIDAANAITLLSGFEIAGGSIIMIIGEVLGNFPPLLFGGLGIVVAGKRGEAAEAIVLKTLNGKKAKMFTEQSNLRDEVKLATGISAAYESLSNQVANAVRAASGMQNAWAFLSDHLGSLINDLNKGTKTTGAIQTIFLKAANTTIKTVLQDTQTIESQMAGVNNIVAKKGQTVGEAIVEVAKGNQTVSTQTTLLLKSSQLNAMSGGVLTQSIGNLNAAAEQIENIVNIPQAAQVIKTQSLTNINVLISQIQSLQGLVGDFVNQAIPQLNDIEANLKCNRPMDEIKTAVDKVCGEASNLNTSVIRVIAAIQSTITTTEGYFNQLASIQADLTQQMTTLQGQLGDAQSQESAAQKKYYYLIALGPFGLIGLAAALALYFAIKKQVDGYQNEINGLNSQIAALNAMKAATGLLSTNFVTVISSVSGVKNSVDFLSSDILAIQTDLSLGDTRTVIEIAVQAGLTEVKTLSIDAS